MDSCKKRRFYSSLREIESVLNIYMYQTVNIVCTSSPPNGFEYFVLSPFPIVTSNEGETYWLEVFSRFLGAQYRIVEMKDVDEYLYYWVAP